MPKASDQRLPAVVVDDVSKAFRRPRERMHTLKERALHPFKQTGFEGFDALKNVSFSVEAGEFFGIVGRNGSGKSTLLKCMAGIYGINGGRIYVNGKLSTFIELGVGFNPDLAAYDNVVMNGIMLGLTPREARSRFERVIEFAELEEFVDLKLKNYSSGMHVRLAFSVMIQVDAEILLIDEVLAVGDASFQQKCFDVFHNMREQGRTILFVTHDMGAVQRFCDRAMLLERGEMVALGEPREVTQKYLEINFGREPTRHSPDEFPGQEPRAGDGKARVVEAWIEDATGERKGVVLQGDACVVRARVRFHEAVRNPSFSFAWVNEHDQNQFIASSHLHDETGASYTAGDEVLVSLTFENHFGPGRYFVSIAVTHPGTHTELIDRWERIFSVVVGGTRAGGGLVDLPHEMRIELMTPETAIVAPTEPA